MERRGLRNRFGSGDYRSEEQRKPHVVWLTLAFIRPKAVDCWATELLHMPRGSLRLSRSGAPHLEQKSAREKGIWSKIVLPQAPQKWVPLIASIAGGIPFAVRTPIKASPVKPANQGKYLRLNAALLLKRKKKKPALPSATHKPMKTRKMSSLTFSSA